VWSAIAAAAEAFGIAVLPILALLDESVQRSVVAWLSLDLKYAW
jgi:hypothetical protein